MKRVFFLSVIISLSGGCSMEKLYTMRLKQKVYAYEQVNFQELMQRYMSKEKSSVGSIEGIYSVSIVIVKKGKGLLSPVEREKIIDRRENYSKVAIIRDENNSNREYLEIPLDKDLLPSYSVRGEFTGMTEANILVYKHFESRGQVATYTFTYDHSRDMLEGVRKENNGQAEYTYTLTYLKLHPKNAEITKID